MGSIEQAIAAKGGLEKLKAVKTLRAVAQSTLSSPQGPITTETVTHHRVPGPFPRRGPPPDWGESSRSTRAVTMPGCKDPNRGVVVPPPQARKDFRDSVQRDVLSLLLRAQAGQFTLRLREQDGGPDAVKTVRSVELSGPDVERVTLFIDTESGMVVREIVPAAGRRRHRRRVVHRLPGRGRREDRVPGLAAARRPAGPDPHGDRRQGERPGRAVPVHQARQGDPLDAHGLRFVRRTVRRSVRRRACRSPARARPRGARDRVRRRPARGGGSDARGRLPRPGGYRARRSPSRAAAVPGDVPSARPGGPGEPARRVRRDRLSRLQLPPGSGHPPARRADRLLHPAAALGVAERAHEDVEGARRPHPGHLPVRARDLSRSRDAGDVRRPPAGRTRTRAYAGRGLPGGRRSRPGQAGRRAAARQPHERGAPDPPDDRPVAAPHRGAGARRAVPAGPRPGPRRLAAGAAGRVGRVQSPSSRGGATTCWRRRRP